MCHTSCFRIRNKRCLPIAPRACPPNSQSARAVHRSPSCLLIALGPWGKGREEFSKGGANDRLTTVPGKLSDAPAADESVAADGSVASIDSSRSRGRRRRRRLDWRQGGTAVRKWNYLVLTTALVGVGAGLIVSVTLNRLGGPWTPFASSIALWAGLGIPVVVAFKRARPAGLLQMRSIDLLWGVGIGGGLRLLQGWLSGADSSTFPTLLRSDGSSVWDGIWSYGIPSVLFAPVIEEFFFRAVILVAVYQLLRRSVGALAAATTALLTSAGGFVLLHAAFSSLSLADGIQFFAVGAVCGLIVLLSGRIWGAVLTHLIYNMTYLALAIVGTILV